MCSDNHSRSHHAVTNELIRLFTPTAPALIFICLLCLIGMISPAQASTIITSPYSGPNLLPLHTDAGPHAETYGPGGTNDNGGVTYKKWCGDQGTPAILDGLFGSDKAFPNGMSSTTSDNMDNQTPSGTWYWWTAHFSNPTVISNFVIRTADHAYDRTPDQFQLRGSNNGTNWTVIYRYDQNVTVDGQSNPWGTIAYGSSPPNNTAVRFDGAGIDFATPEAYIQIRLELFSSAWSDGVGITEWQLAGAAPPQPPKVDITSPTNNATLGTNFTIIATASDRDGTVTNVDFYDGTNILCSVTTSACFYVWNPAPTGQHALAAVARDDVGLFTTSAIISITVTADNIAPSVAITNPVNGSMVSTNFTIFATAYDVDGAVTNVDFYTNGVLFYSDTSEPYECVWLSAPCGSNELKAVAWDDKGQTTTSIAVSVIATNLPPAVAITDPTDGAILGVGDPVLIRASATDSDGITGVDFFTNGVFFKSDTSYPYECTWSNAPRGYNTLMATALDGSGLTGQSAVVTFRSAYGRGTIVTTPYNGPDLLALHTDAGPHDQNYSGGMSDNGGVTYLKYGDGTTVAMLDANPIAGTWGPGDGNGKFFMGAGLYNNDPATAEQMDANNPVGSWLWWNVHFDNPVIITRFVYRTADAANARTPDQFQLRGSNDGNTWDLIYRFDNNGGDTPWGLPGGIDDNTAVQFNGDGIDFPTPATYTQVRLEVFSATQNGDGVGITEWQLAGIAPPYIENDSGAWVSRDGMLFDLMGTLHTAGEGTANVSVYWGPNDSSNNATAWAHCDNLASSTSRTPVAYSHVLGPLDLNTTYFYRYYASNDVMGVWATNSASFKSHGGTTIIVR